MKLIKEKSTLFLIFSVIFLINNYSNGSVVKEKKDVPVPVVLWHGMGKFLFTFSFNI